MAKATAFARSNAPIEGKESFAALLEESLQSRDSFEGTVVRGIVRSLPGQDVTGEAPALAPRTRSGAKPSPTAKAKPRFCTKAKPSSHRAR